MVMKVKLVKEHHVLIIVPATVNVLTLKIWKKLLGSMPILHHTLVMTIHPIIIITGTNLKPEVVNADPSSYFSDDYPSHNYYYWDKSKTRGCQCDPEWFDVDCSKRMCPYGNDVMDHRLDLTATRLFQKQRIYLSPLARSSGLSDPAYTEDRTFALTFKSKMNETFTTQPIQLQVATG